MEIYEGQHRVFERFVSEEMVLTYAQLSGDYNPIHIDEDYAKTTMFNKRIAHGMLAGALISSILGCEFPGEGTIYLKQNMSFVAPIYLETTVLIHVRVLEISKKKRCLLETIICDENEKMLVKGEALVQLA